MNSYIKTIKGLKILLSKIQNEIRENRTQNKECFNNLNTENLVKQQELTLEYERLFNTASEVRSLIEKLEELNSKFDEEHKKELDFLEESKKRLNRIRSY